MVIINTILYTGPRSKAREITIGRLFRYPARVEQGNPAGRGNGENSGDSGDSGGSGDLIM